MCTAVAVRTSAYKPGSYVLLEMIAGSYNATNHLGNRNVRHGAVRLRPFETTAPAHANLCNKIRSPDLRLSVTHTHTHTPDWGKNKTY